ncbi:hypothetical protein BJ085DRAFT_21016, partial [Dimargaris cristalligena]
LPILGGQTRFDLGKRLDFSGQACADTLLKLLQLKYPTLPTKISPYQAQYMVHHHTYFATDYRTELVHYRDPEFLAREDHVIQFPFTLDIPEEKSEEELARLTEKRREQMRRMQEIAAKNRLDKLIKNEQDLESYQRVKEGKETESKSAYTEQIRALGFRSENEMDQQIKKLEQLIERARNKDLGVEKAEEGPPSFPLVEIPDDQLSEVERKEKRKQRLLKAGYDARERARRVKEEERLRKEEQEQQEVDRRTNDLEGWLEELKRKRIELIDKMTKREQLKQQLADRRSHISQMRMKSISALASNDNTSSGAAAAAGGGARRRRVGGRGGGPSDDTFGADDNDWAVYREISKEDGSDEEEEEENDQLLLIQYEEKLNQYAPTYLADLLQTEQETIRNSVLYKFSRGTSVIPPPETPEETEQLYQIHLNVERIKVPEALFQPSMVGVEQAGLLEVIDGILKQLNAAQRTSISKNIFLTGGPSLIPNLQHRLQTSMRSILPVGSALNVHRARDPINDAWRGAARWASTVDSNLWNQYAITKAEYEEYGPAYLKEHAFGNRYYQPPAE